MLSNSFLKQYFPLIKNVGEERREGKGKEVLKTGLPG